jgi:predicted O-methyltransferase YrrM
MRHEQGAPVVQGRKSTMQKQIAKIPVVGRIVNSAYRSTSALFDQVQIDRLSSTGQPHAERVANVLRRFEEHKRRLDQAPFNKIEALRQQMLLRDEPVDDGTLMGSGPYDKGVTVRDACRVSKPRASALFLYDLIQEFKPANAIELGTNVGISSAYIASALDKGRLVTLEASPYRLRVAQKTHAELGLKNVTYVQGLFADTLESTLQTMAPVDFAFIDGHHLYQPTLDYYHTIEKYLAKDALVVFDDIRWSPGMKQAWRELQIEPRVRLAVDLHSMGVCVVAQMPSIERRAKTSVHFRSVLP